MSIFKMQRLPHCPPRHTRGVPPLSGELCFQLFTIESRQNAAPYTKQGKVKPCVDVQSHEYFHEASKKAKENEVKPWFQDHVVDLYGRTEDGFSVYVQVATPIKVAVEFPVTHCDFKRHVKSYFLAMEDALNFEPGYICTGLKANFSMRAQSNNWVPDPEDRTKPRKVPVAVVAFKNHHECRKAVRWMQETEVVGQGLFKYKVSVWETVDYVKPQQRFILENDLQPGGWVTVSNPLPLEWACTLCDIEAHCVPHQLTPDHQDQSIAPLTTLSWDIEVCNGTAEQRKRMKELGLDRFPNAAEPSNTVIQVSVGLDMADGRALNFLLELDNRNQHTGARAVEDRSFEDTDYRVFYFQSEVDMLVFFRDMIVYYDPDVLLSFNGDRFDWPYVIARVGDRLPDSPHGRFSQMGRFITDRWETKRAPFRVVGSKDVPVINVEKDDMSLPRRAFPLAQLAMERGVELTPELSGRIALDLCSFIRDMSKADKFLAFKNYTLDNMAERFLGDHKVNFNHGDIFDAWSGIMPAQRFLAITSGSSDSSWLTTPGPREDEVNVWLQRMSGATLEDLRSRCQEAQVTMDAVNVERKSRGLKPLTDPEEVLCVHPEAQRRVLGDYCMKDTLLPLRIMKKLGTITFLWQVSRVARTAPHNIINNGQMMRVSTMFIGEAWRQGRVVNRVKNRAMAYQGATVLTPNRYYYGGGNGKDLVHDGGSPLPAEIDFVLPPIPLNKADRDLEGMTEFLAQRVDEMDDALMAKYGVTRDAVLTAAMSAVEHLPDGYDFSNMRLVEIYQTKANSAVLTLDFKSLYPSIMLSHYFCPSTLLQTDEPPTDAERYADLYKAHMKGSPKTAEASVPEDEVVVFEELEEERDELQRTLDSLKKEATASPKQGKHAETLRQTLADLRRELVVVERKIERERRKIAVGPAIIEEPEEEEEVVAEDVLDGHPSGEVKGLADEKDYTTVCIVVTDSKGLLVARRYHKYTKHDKGIYPVMLQQLLDGRAIYKKKMNLEKAMQGSLELFYDEAMDEGIVRVGDVEQARVVKAVDELRDKIKPVVKDKVARAREVLEWSERHKWVRGAQELVMTVVDTLVNIYDGRQKALKVMANSIYGVSGAKQHSPCACCKLAESVTAVGRQMIESSKECALTTFAHYGTKVVYGDSVTGDTAMVVRIDGVVQVRRMDELASDWYPYHESKEAANVPGLEVLDETGWTVVNRVIRHKTEKAMFRVVTHTGVVDCTEDHGLLRPYGEKVAPGVLTIGEDLMHLSADTWSTLDTVTDCDVSVDEAKAMGLFAADGSCGIYDTEWGVKYSWAINNSDRDLLVYTQELLPFETKILDTLASSGVYKLVPVGRYKAIVQRYRAMMYNSAGSKRIPEEILFGPKDVAEAFFYGFYAGDGDHKEQDRQTCWRFDQKSKTMATCLYILSSRLGWNVSINTYTRRIFHKDKPDIFRLTLTKGKQRNPASAIKNIIPLPRTAEMVYDLETESHHFHVGPGNMVVHNTDSIFVHIEEPDDKKAWAVAKEMADYITRVIFAGTVNILEDECIKRMLALFKKKTYVALENEDVKTGIYKRGEKGIASVRRDKPEVLNILVRALNASFTELGNFPRNTIARLLLRKCCAHFEAMVQNTIDVSNYVIVQRINKMTKESAHLVMARKMEARTGTPVMRGDSVSYVHIKNDREKLATRRVESPVVMRSASDIEVDRAYYLSNKVQGIISSTLELFMPPEVITVLFDVYQTVLDAPWTQTLAQAYGTSTVSAAEDRHRRVERALETAIRRGRMPSNYRLPTPMVSGKRKVSKPTAAELAKEREKNLAQFERFLVKREGATTQAKRPAKVAAKPTKASKKAATQPVKTLLDYL